jgi:alanine-glyoxylate transaminase/serine-glyoxylate transaminase/serine-pyruvate transaminase
MHRQPLDLVDKRLIEIARSCFEGVRDLAQTSGHVFIYAANGHGGWEAALANVCMPGDMVLVPEIGHFSNSWAEHARALGIETDVISGDWRRGIDPQRIEERLRQDKGGRIKAVLAVQVDTGTGIASDIPAIRAAIDAAGHPALLVVDTIASFGAMPFTMDAWGVDVMVAASQKALMCPPGLAIVAANEKALRVCASLPRRHRYWDWMARTGGEYYTKFCGTMPEHLFFGLHEALAIIREEGLPSIHARHRMLAGAVHRAVEVWSEGGALAFNAVVPAERAVSVTAIRVSGSVDAEHLRSHARESLGVSIAGGLGAMHGQAVRIGHLGDLNVPMILGCLSALELAFIELGIPHGANGLRAAVEHLATQRADLAAQTDESGAAPGKVAGAFGT